MWNFTLLVLHFAVSYLHATLFYQLNIARRENLTLEKPALRMMFLMLICVIYHVIAGIVVLNDIYPWMNMDFYRGNDDWPLYLMTGLIVPMVFSRLTKLPENPSRIAKFLCGLTTNSSQIGLGIGMLGITFYFSPWRDILNEQTDGLLSLIIFIPFYLLCQIIKEVSFAVGLKASTENFVLSNFGKPGKRFESKIGYVILPVMGFVILTGNSLGSDYGFLIIISSAWISLFYAWYGFRLQFIDTLLNQFVRLLLLYFAVVGAVFLLDWARSITANQGDPLLIMTMYVLVTATVAHKILHWCQTIWQPPKSNLQRIHKELPQLLSLSTDPEESIRLTEKFLGELFLADIVINTSFAPDGKVQGKSVEHLLVGDSPKLSVQLGLIKSWVPWLSEAIFWVRTGLLYLQNHLQLLDSMESIQQQKLRSNQLSQLAAQAELKAMRAQIQPHFLFNTLNTIHSFVRKNPLQAKNTIILLSNLMKGVLQSSRRDRISLSKELVLCDNYMEIEKVRFGERLRYRTRVETNLDAVKIPFFCIQPLVENAVKHGVAAQFEAVTVEIVINSDKEKLYIKVKDDGPGLTKDHRKHNGLSMALENIRQRLEKMYQGAASLTLQNRKSKGVCAQLTIPLWVDAL